MKKLSLELPLDIAYSFVDETTIGIKSSVMSLCSDIDRYLRIKFGIYLSDEITSYEIERIKDLYPFLSNLDLEQFNRLLTIFRNIRNINAHLHFCKPVYIDDDIVEKLTYFVQPDYAISKDKKLTLYGEAYILFFLSQKYNLFPFITTFFSKRYFVEIRNMTGKEKSNFHIATQHLFQNLCGVGKPIFPEVKNKMEYQYMNDIFRRNTTRLIYSLEKCCSNTKKGFDSTMSISKLLNNTGVFDHNNEVYELIIFLRNCWLHGCMLDEEVDFNGIKIKLSYKFIFESFSKIKKCLTSQWANFNLVIDELNNFAISSINFYVLRVVEVAYKILDNRLLTVDKVESRIENINKALARVERADKEFFELAGDLLEPDDLNFYIGQSKFLDSKERITNCYRLKIIKFHSDNGFDIGDFHTDNTELALAVVDLDEEYANMINGKHLEEYGLTNEVKYGNRISIYNAVM